MIIECIMENKNHVPNHQPAKEIISKKNAAQMEIESVL
jgi:hypothetical protein